MNFLKIKTLGYSKIWLDEKELHFSLPQKAQAILIYCAFQNQEILRTNLAAMFWPEYPQTRAMHNLRMAIEKLKQQLPENVIVNRHVIQVCGPLEIDIQKLELGLKTAELAKQIEVLNLYEGEFLEHFFVKDANDFENWRLAFAQKVKTQVSEAYIRIINKLYDKQAWQEALNESIKLYNIDPEREASHYLLMHLHFQTGNRQAALEQFEILRKFLEEHYAIAPSAATIQLYQRIRNNEHYTSPSISINRPLLPEFSNNFVGREKEINDLAAILKQRRLVSLVGIGGVGKTRLAIALGKQLAADYSYGAIYIRLDQQDLLVTLAEVLKVDIHYLLNSLHDKQMLLIIDIISANSKIIAAARQILDNAPQLTILIASRLPLNLYGEYLHKVLPLVFPSKKTEITLENYLDFDAITLFVNRSKDQISEFKLDASNMNLVAQICTKLAGIPFAIELAAAQLPVWGLEALAEMQFNGDHLPYQTESQTTLFEMIEWSYQQLQVSEQAVYRSLSLLEGVWTLKLAKSIFQEELDVNWGLTLQALLEKGLIRSDSGYDGRFTMLDPIKDHALWHLQAANEESAKRRILINFFLDFTKVAMYWIDGQIQEIDDNYDTIRAILLYTQQDSQWLEAHSQLIGSLGFYWLYYGKHHEALAWIKALKPHYEQLSLSSRAGVAAAHGHAAYAISDVAVAYNQHKAALELYQVLGDRFNEAFMLYCLSAHVQDLDEQISYCARCLEIAHEIEADWLIAIVLVNYSEAHRHKGDYQTARELIQEGLRLAKALDIDLIKAGHLLNLSDILLSTEHFHAAKLYLKQAIQISEKTDNDNVIIEAIGMLADIEGILNQAKTAQQLLQRALDIVKRTQIPMEHSLIILRQGRLARLHGNKEETNAYLLEALAMWLNTYINASRQWDLWLQLCDDVFIQLVLLEDFDEAERLYKYVEDIRKKLGYMRRPYYNAIVERYHELSRDKASQTLALFVDKDELILWCANLLAKP